MFTHDTKNENVLMHIDFFKKEGEYYTVNGWILHKKDSIKSILIDNKEIRFARQNRDDVKAVYTFIPTSEVGVILLINKNQLNKKISLVLNDGSIIEDIGTLEKWYIKNSGFADLTTQLVIVDNFYKDPDAVRNFAINNLEFRPSGYHKGNRTDRVIIDGTKEKFEQILGKKIINWHHPNYANGAFQFCIKDNPIVYHVDQQMYAGVVFLTPNAPLESGTVTYKSTKTGKFKFTKEELGSSDFIATFADSNGNLNFYDRSNLKMVDSVANIYNRLVLFESRSIHAAESYFGDNINNSRLFHIFFFDVVE
jgi:hypothetical protein